MDKVATPSQVLQMVMEEAHDRGLTWFKPYHAAGMVGSFMQETGDFREDVINFDLKGDKGTAYGLMQWRGDRWSNLQRYASEKGIPLNDIKTQISFAFEEMNPTSSYADSGSVRAMKEFESAKNSNETALSFVHAERSAGYDGNPSNAHDSELRISHANRALNGFGNDNNLDQYTGKTSSQSNSSGQRKKLFSEELVDRLSQAGFKTANVPDFKIFKSRNQAISGNAAQHDSSIDHGNHSHNKSTINPHMRNGVEDNNYIRYTNQNATRNDPLSQKLVDALGFLGEMGVTAEVFSGGQENNTTHGLGSTRHNHGNAADVFFYKDGRKLNYNNPDDLPIYEEIVRKGKAAGLTGFGAGDGYMQPGSMHLGFGGSAVWGANGDGENAPQWLRNAYNGTSHVSPQSNGFVENTNFDKTVSGKFGFNDMNGFGLTNNIQSGNNLDFGLPENPVLGLTNTFDQSPRPRNDLTFGNLFGST